MELPSLSGTNVAQTGRRKHSGAEYSIGESSISSNSAPTLSHHSAPNSSQLNSATVTDTVAAMTSHDSSQDSASSADHQKSDLPSVAEYSHSFEIRKPFSLPMPDVTVSFEKLLSTVWIKELKEILSKFLTNSHKSITVLVADHTFRAALVNWIITATVVVQPPVSNILVFSLDEYLYELLKSRRISCIHVDPTTIINPSFDFTDYQNVMKIKAVTIQMTVTRFINHWGFNIFLCDINALIMQNPQTIYQQYGEADIIGSCGLFPEKNRERWGFTVSMGIIWIRSSPQTGE